MAKNILITGATGLIGQHLIPELQKESHRITILARKEIKMTGVKVYLWDVYQQTIATDAFEGIDTIIHLAGEGIADQKWTAQRKKQIIDSRVLSAQLLYRAIQETKAPVSTFITASAVGLYGDRGEEFLTEASSAGDGFLANCCLAWENAAKQGITMGIRVVQIRIGLILSEAGGVLKVLEKPIKYFVGAPLGTGKQWMPWIHLTDLIGVFVKAVEDEKMSGPYNAVAPFPVTNKLLTKTIAQKLNRPCWPIHVPESVLKAILGESSVLPLMSTNIMADRLLKAGYNFKYTNLGDALDSIY